MSVYLYCLTYFTRCDVVADWRFPIDGEKLETYFPEALGKWPMGNP